MLTVYGIANCDTIKKTKNWLTENGLEFEFHDYKKLGISAELAQRMIAELSLEKVINTRGTTWRKLPETEKESLNSTRAIELMQRKTSLIKRPIINANGQLLVGFDDATRQALTTTKT